MERTFYKTWSCLLALISLLALLQVADSCSCRLTHPQKKLCGSDFVGLVKVLGETYFGFHSLYEYSDIAYEVEIKQVFKERENLTEALQESKLYTVNDRGNCGVKLAINETYVLSAYMESGKLNILRCNMIMRWQDVSSFQRQAFEGLYKNNCQCKITDQDSFSPNESDTTSTPLEMTCLYGDSWERCKLLDEYGICMEAQGKCAWQSLDKNYSFPSTKAADAAGITTDASF